MELLAKATLRYLNMVYDYVGYINGLIEALGLRLTQLSVIL